MTESTKYPSDLSSDSHAMHFADDEGRIDVSLPCPTCDYELVTQPLAGHCPECGQAIMPMLERNPVTLAPAKWVGTLKWGTVLMLAGLLGLPLAIIGLEFTFVLPDVWIEIIHLLPIALLISSIYLLCAKEPDAAYASSAESTARFGRHVAVSAGFVFVCMIVLFMADDYFYWFAYRTVYVLGAVTLTLLATTIIVGITASVYRLDALHSRQRPGTKRFGGATLKHLLAWFIGFFLAAWLLQIVDVWLFMYADVDQHNPVLAVVTALFVGLVLLSTIVFALWLAVLLAARWFTFRHAHRIAASREAVSRGAQ